MIYTYPKFTFSKIRHIHKQDMRHAQLMSDCGAEGIVRADALNQLAERFELSYAPEDLGFWNCEAYWSGKGYMVAKLTFTNSRIAQWFHVYQPMTPIWIEDAA